MRSLPRYREKVERLENYNLNTKEKIERTSEELLVAQEQVKKIVKIRINQLMKYIFPISAVYPKV